MREGFISGYGVRVSYGPGTMGRGLTYVVAVAFPSGGQYWDALTFGSGFISVLLDVGLALGLRFLPVILLRPLRGIIVRRFAFISMPRPTTTLALEAGEA